MLNKISKEMLTICLSLLCLCTAADTNVCPGGTCAAKDLKDSGSVDDRIFSESNELSFVQLTAMEKRAKEAAGERSVQKMDSAVQRKGGSAPSSASSDTTTPSKDSLWTSVGDGCCSADRDMDNGKTFGGNVTDLDDCKAMCRSFGNCGIIEYGWKDMPKWCFSWATSQKCKDVDKDCKKSVPGNGKGVKRFQFNDPKISPDDAAKTPWDQVGKGCCDAPRDEDNGKLYAGKEKNLNACKARCLSFDNCGLVEYGWATGDPEWCYIWSDSQKCKKQDLDCKQSAMGDGRGAKIYRYLKDGATKAEALQDKDQPADEAPKEEIKPAEAKPVEEAPNEESKQAAPVAEAKPAKEESKEEASADKSFGGEGDSAADNRFEPPPAMSKAEAEKAETEIFAEADEEKAQAEQAAKELAEQEKAANALAAQEAAKQLALAKAAKEKAAKEKAEKAKAAKEKAEKAKAAKEKAEATKSKAANATKAKAAKASNHEPAVMTDADEEQEMERTSEFAKKWLKQLDHAEKQWTWLGDGCCAADRDDKNGKLWGGMVASLNLCMAKCRSFTNCGSIEYGWDDEPERCFVWDDSQKCETRDRDCKKSVPGNGEGVQGFKYIAPTLDRVVAAISTWDTMGAGCCEGPREEDNGKLYAGREPDLESCKARCLSFDNCGVVEYGWETADPEWCFIWDDSQKCEKRDVECKQSLLGGHARGAMAYKLNRPQAVDMPKDEKMERKATPSVENKAKAHIMETEAKPAVEKKAKADKTETKATTLVDKKAKAHKTETKATPAAEKKAKADKTETKATPVVEKKAKADKTETKVTPVAEKKAKADKMETKATTVIAKKVKATKTEAKPTVVAEKKELSKAIAAEVPKAKAKAKATVDDSKTKAKAVGAAKAKVASPVAHTKTEVTPAVDRKAQVKEAKTKAHLKTEKQTSPEKKREVTPIVGSKTEAKAIGAAIANAASPVAETKTEATPTVEKKAEAKAKGVAKTKSDAAATAKAKAVMNDEPDDTRHKSVFSTMHPWSGLGAGCCAADRDATNGKLWGGPLPSLDACKAKCRTFADCGLVEYGWTDQPENCFIWSKSQKCHTKDADCKKSLPGNGKGVQGYQFIAPIIDGKGINNTVWDVVGPGCCAGEREESNGKLYAAREPDLHSCKARCLSFENCGIVEYGWAVGDPEWCFIWDNTQKCEKQDVECKNSALGGQGASGMQAHRFVKAEE